MGLEDDLWENILSAHSLVDRHICQFTSLPELLYRHKPLHIGNKTFLYEHVPPGKTDTYIAWLNLTVNMELSSAEVCGKVILDTAAVEYYHPSDRTHRLHESIVNPGASSNLSETTSKLACFFLSVFYQTGDVQPVG